MAKPIARVVSRAPVATCGTDAGYRRHLRHRALPCQRCRDAHTLAEVQRTGRIRLYERALAGDEPAEALDTDLREQLVATLCARGWDVQRIAAHTRTTTYTTARIRDRLVAAGVTTPNLEEKTA